MSALGGHAGPRELVGATLCAACGPSGGTEVRITPELLHYLIGLEHAAQLLAPLKLLDAERAFIAALWS